MRSFAIAASILSADFSRLGEEVDAVLAAGADMIHFDVMDNHYVPNLSFGPMVCKALRTRGVKAPIDVHLMAKPVDQLILDFAEAGASNITIHPEATLHPDRSLQLIREQGCRAGLAFNPGTPTYWLDYLLDVTDIVLVMGVNPGFGGQQLIPTTLDKIAEVREIIDDSDLAVALAVDGGVNLDNIKSLAEAGADTFVTGSAIFGCEEYMTPITRMRQELGRQPEVRH